MFRLITLNDVVGSHAHLHLGPQSLLTAPKSSCTILLTDQKAPPDWLRAAMPKAGSTQRALPYNNMQTVTTGTDLHFMDVLLCSTAGHGVGIYSVEDFP